jgi:isopentenyl diphosphate isomerase/L-lactate dehydrogenase-like FMN-dependent dehydrogenase
MIHMGTEWVKEMSSGRQRSWDELKLIRDNWEGPLVLKGIQCAADAELAIDAGQMVSSSRTMVVGKSMGEFRLCGLWSRS